MENHNPKISVVMSVYNGAKYIKEAVRSVLEQTEKDFELLITDDCSTDNTVAILKSIQDTRIILIENETQKGLTQNLITMVAKARGKYIARIDADDLCKANRFEVQSRVLDETDNFMVCSYAKKFGSQKGIIKTPINYDYLKADMLFRCPIVHSSVMFRNDHSINYDATYKKTQDYDLWDRMITSGRRIAVVNKPLVAFRYHSSQISNTFSFDQVRFSLDIRIRKMRRLGIVMSKEELKRIDDFLNQKSQNNDYITVVNFLEEIREKNLEACEYDDRSLQKVLSAMYTKLYISIKKRKIKLRRKDYKLIRARVNVILLIKMIIMDILAP